VAEDCASEGNAIWWAVQELRDHTTYCPHIQYQSDSQCQFPLMWISLVTKVKAWPQSY